MNIALQDDLHRLLREKVENGEFPNEEAVVEEALKCFLNPEPSRGDRDAVSPADVPKGRLPGPFLEDPAAPTPSDLPRQGRERSCPSIPVTTRQPTLFPGE